MAESIKLNDSKYIDTEGVWDSTLGKSQSAINTQFKALYYDANTDRTVQANRESAIKAVLDGLTFTTPKAIAFTIRYSGGYYPTHLAIFGASTDVSVLEYSIYDAKIRLYKYERTTLVCSQMKEF